VTFPDLRLAMNHVALVAIAAAGAAILAPAQSHPEGLHSTVQALAPTAGAALVHAQGLVTFDGQDLWLAPPAAPPVLLLHLPAPAFASLLADAGAGRVLFGDSSNALWLVPLQGPAPAAPLAMLPLAYDAVLLLPQRALVSAKTGGFGAADNDLVLVDLTNGALQTVARLPGASGPLERDPGGDVYYATASNAFPPPPASCSVLRLRAGVLAQAIATSTVLGLAQAELVFAGLDVASDLALDDDGDLHFADWLHARVGELNDVAGSAVTLGAPTVDYALAPFGAVTLQFVPAAASAGFEPFSPAAGTLHVFESDFFTASRLRAVQPAAAVLAASAPSPIASGAVTLAASAGPANGIGVLAFATVQAPGTVELGVPGFEQRLHWSLALLAPPVTVVLPFDAAGTASFAFVNPGFAPALPATAQVLFVSATHVLGATAPLALAFGQ
jgi:hypothetical protein